MYIKNGETVLKICPRCKEAKSLGEFPISKRHRFGRKSPCKKCGRNIAREYRKTDRWHKWRKDYYNRNIEVERKRARDYRRAHIEKFRERDNKRREKDPERNRRVAKEWRQAFPERYKALAHNRRARELNAGGRFSESEWRMVMQKYGSKCLCCGRSVPEINLTPDHVIPLSRGGSNSIDNIQPLCFMCNRKKMTKSTDYRNL